MKWFEYILVFLKLFSILILNTIQTGVDTSDTPSTSTVQDIRDTIHKTNTEPIPNLIGMDYFSKSDPMCVVYDYAQNISQWRIHSRTETIDDNHNPDFVKKFEMDYQFEVQQPVGFEVYDIDSPSPDLKNHDFLGYASTTLGRIVHARKIELQLNMKQKITTTIENQLTIQNDTKKINRRKPYIIVRAEKLKTADLINEDRVIFEFSGSNIARRNWFGMGKSNPYIDIYKATDSEATDYVLIRRLEEIKLTTKPHWKRFSILFTSLADADRNRKLKFVCKNWHRRKDHSIIGEVETTIAQIEDENRKSFELIHPRKQNKNSGYFHIEYYDFWKTYPFLEYIMGGLNIHCIIAIDFTASNKDPRFEDSLHYIHRSSNTSFLNHYQQAITSVVSIIEDYNTDKKFLVLGFGAVLPPPSDEEASHMFYVNMNEANDPQDPYNNPFSVGVDGVLEAYRKILPRIQLSGPTHFAPFIRHVVEEFVQKHQDGDNYYILLVLTDGQIMDMENTKRIIIRGSRLPLSIIIVGIGDQNFDSMKTLDGDIEPLQMDGIEAERDIVQFVPFNKFFMRRNDREAKQHLAKEVLAEVPRQLETYMASRHFKPKLQRVHSLESTSDPDKL